MSTLKFTTVPSKTLAESITAAATSFRLNNIEGWDEGDLVAGDFGSIHYVVFRNSTKTRIEIMEIDPTTIASASITINKRGLDYTGDITTEVTANKLPWTKGDTYVDLGTDTPQMFQWLKEYIDDASIAGAVPATTSAAGIAKIGTQAQVDAGSTGDGTYKYLVTADNLRGGNYNDYVVDTGSANAYAIAPSPAITAYATGQIFTFKAVNANTIAAAPTLNVNSLGVKTIKKRGSTAVSPGDIAANSIVTVGYDGTDFQLLNVVGISSVQTFDASGTYTKPGGLVRVRVQAWGGGGSGGRATVASDEVGGGGGGGYNEVWLEASAIAATETVTIGAGGAARSTNTTGAAGGTTTFGSLVTAYGGGGGATGGTGAGGGGGGSVLSAGGQASSATAGTAGVPFGTAGGSGSDATVAVGAFHGAGGGQGTTASTGQVGGNSVNGGGGGGGAGTTAGAGGTSQFGGNGGAASIATSGNATSGSQPAGGGGAKHTNGGTGDSGAGGAGRVIVTEYYV